MPAPRIAIRDPALSAELVSRAPLRFAGGADEATDRPAHLRAASGLAALGSMFAVVLDDVNFVALVDPRAPAQARAIALPPGPGGRRQFGDSRATKHLKLDLEACVATGGDSPMLVAFGSGSSPARESVVVVRDITGATPVAEIVHAPALYGRLRTASSFAGSELNVEGALLLGDTLRLFGRGNGAVAGELRPVNATCDLSWPGLLAHLRAPREHAAPESSRIRQFLLGELAGVPLGFTDATAWGDAILFTAAAEASPDATRDGEVHGSAIGIIDARGDVRWTPIVDASGRVVREKAEGLLVADDARGELWVVADRDDESQPSELCRIRLRGPWRAGDQEARSDR